MQNENTIFTCLARAFLGGRKTEKAMRTKVDEDMGK